MGMQRPLPERDTDAAPFWKGAAERQLLIQRCSACGAYQHYARPFCLSCRSAAVEMVASAGHGVLHSFTIVNRSPFEDVSAPYVVGLVRLDEGVTLLTNIVECEPGAVACDMPVEVTYLPLREDVVLPVFRPRNGT